MHVFVGLLGVLQGSQLIERRCYQRSDCLHDIEIFVGEGVQAAVLDVENAEKLSAQLDRNGELARRDIEGRLPDGVRKSIVIAQNRVFAPALVHHGRGRGEDVVI